MFLRLLLTTVLITVVTTGTARSQTVQLPTQRVFSVRTTVSVPDRGGLYLGGVNRASYGSASRGVPGLGRLPYAGRLFGDRSIGSSVGTSGASVRATIIDHREMDARLLAEAAARRGGAGRPSSVDEADRALMAHVRAGNATTTMHGEQVPLGASLAEIRARHRKAQSRPQDALQTMLDRGLEAEAAGRWGAARCCYSIVAQRGSERLKSEAHARLARLKTAETNEMRVTKR